jgi:hypothetical protein
VGGNHRLLSLGPPGGEEPFAQVLGERGEQRCEANAVALGVAVTDCALADVLPGEAADDLLGPRAGVGEQRDERAVTRARELVADLFDFGGEEDVRLARADSGACVRWRRG